MSVRKIQIPPQVYNFTLDITVSSVFLTFWFRYLETVNMWVFSVYGSSGNLLLSGVPIILGQELLSNHYALTGIVGTLLPYDPTGELERVGADDLAVIELVLTDNALEE